MATASVVSLPVKTSLDSAKSCAEGASLNAIILQFPCPRSLEQRIRARVEADARNMPPSAYPVDVEFSARRKLSLANWLIANGKYNRFWVQKLEA